LKKKLKAKQFENGNKWLARWVLSVMVYTILHCIALASNSEC
jgi:hypothetical protein